MNFLKLAVILLLSFGSLWSWGDEGNYDLERIKLTSGKIYHEIQIIEGDKYGLLFRHRMGIAKVPFSFLSMNLRMLYEPVADVPEGAGSSESVEEESAPDEASSPEPASTWSVQARVYQASSSRQFSRGAIQGPPSLGYLPEYRVPWKSHWGPYPLALSLANPRFRALAVEDFLAVAFPAAHPCPTRSYPVPLRTYYSRY